ncbi:MAG: hypothetical protein PHE50_02320 [Dehalococcoidales bacterium]|nr:hypothetical protein [Dehalococcoidales bacterium]
MTKQTPVFSQEYELKSPSKEGAYAVPESDWNRLKKTISRIKSGDTLFLSLAFFFLGVAPTALFAAMSMPPNTEDVKLVIFWSVFASSTLAGIICFIVHFVIRRDLTYTKKEAEDCMKDIEGQYPKQNQ